MRLIDADALKEEINKKNVVGRFNTLLLIDNAPTVEPTFKPIAEIKFDKEKLQEIVDKAKAEILAQIERPQGEWKLHGMIYYCSECGHDCGESGDNFCGNCGADMRGDINGERNAN